MTSQNNSIFNWKLENTPSIFKNVETYEKIDKEYIYGFINNGMGINYRNVDNEYDIKYQDEQKHMLNYLKLEEDGYFFTKHKPTDHGWGRILPQDHLSQAVMVRKTRHTLCKDNYVDIDMENCHPNIFLAFAKEHKMEHKALEEYCNNVKKTRESIIKFHVPELLTDNMTDETKSHVKMLAKTLILRICYGGKYKTWKTDNNIKGNTYHPLVLQIEKELLAISFIIAKNNHPMLADIRKTKEYVKDYKRNMRTIMSTWAQTIERKLQECAITYVTSKDLETEYEYPALESIIPCQDGFMMPIENYDDDICNRINEYVQTQLPYNIKFVKKEFDECIYIPKEKKLNDNVHSHNDDETDFYSIDYEYYEVNDRNINVDMNEFESADIVIIESGTGTGKSRLISKLWKEYKQKHPECNILALSSLTTILQQLQETFKRDGTELLHYSKESDVDLINNDSILCINSILKIDGFDYGNTILYIDEPTHMLMNMVNNETIKKLKQVTACFIDLFKNCKKVVLTDAHMNKSVMDLIKLRKTEEDDIYRYVNKYQKFAKSKDTPVVQAESVTDVDSFAKKMIDKVKSGSKFVFCSDSLQKCEKYYALCMKASKPEDKKKFFLITKHTDTDFNVATDINFNNAWVFYSPKITCGLSVITKKNIDCFMYIQGGIISPISLYQQATRVRSMNKMYYHIEQTTTKFAKYNSYKSCQEYFKKKISDFNELSNMCTYIDEDGSNKINDNFFFNLYTHKEYTNSIQFQNIRHFFELELNKSGFQIIRSSDICDESFEQELEEVLVEHKKHEITELEGIIEEEFKNEKTGNYLIKRCQYLKINDAESVNRYKNVIQDNNLFETVQRFEKTLRSKKYIQDKIRDLKSQKYTVEVCDNSYTKVLLLRLFEETFDIDPLNINDFRMKESKIENKKEIWDLIQSVKRTFRLTSVLLDSVDNIKSAYIKMLKHLVGGLKIFKGSRLTIDGEKKRTTKYDEKTLQEYIDLIVMKSNNCVGYFDNTIMRNISNVVDIKEKCFYNPYEEQSNTKTTIEYMLDDN